MLVCQEYQYPGEDIIKQAIEHNIDIEVLPGATASITALVGLGLETAKFAFEGFLDRDKKAKKKPRLKN